MHNYKRILRYHHERYKKLEDVICPAIGNSIVHFNDVGFKHLIWKGMRPRKHSEIMSRLTLLKHADIIIQSANASIEYRIVPIETSKIQYWGLTVVISGKEITVVIRQVGNGLKHFYSIFIRR